MTTLGVGWLLGYGEPPNAVGRCVGLRVGMPCGAVVGRGMGDMVGIEWQQPQPAPHT